MNVSDAIADQLREASFVKREALDGRERREVFDSGTKYASRTTFHASETLHGIRFTRNARIGYGRLLTTVTSLRPAPQAHSSLDRLGPIRDARPGNFAGMHAICGVFGQNNPGTDAGKYEWLIQSVIKEE